MQAAVKMGDEAAIQSSERLENTPDDLVLIFNSDDGWVRSHTAELKCDACARWEAEVLGESSARGRAREREREKERSAEWTQTFCHRCGLLLWRGY